MTLGRLILLNANTGTRAFVRQARDPGLNNVVQLTHHDLGGQKVERRRTKNGIVLPNRFIPLLPRELNSNRSLQVATRLNSTKGTRPQGQVKFTENRSFKRYVNGFLFDPLILTNNSRVATRRIFRLSRRFRIGHHVITPIS